MSLTALWMMDAGCVTSYLEFKWRHFSESSFILLIMWNLQCRPDSINYSLINDKENEDAEFKRRSQFEAVSFVSHSKSLFSVLLSSQPDQQASERLTNKIFPSFEESEIITYSHWQLVKGIFAEQIFVFWPQLFIIQNTSVLMEDIFPFIRPEPLRLLLKYENWNLKP